MADGYVYLINKENFREKTINSDTVSIVASLSRLSEDRKFELVNMYKLYLLFLIASYNNIINYQCESNGLDFNKAEYQETLNALFERLEGNQHIQIIIEYIDSLIKGSNQSFQEFVSINYHIIVFSLSLNLKEFYDLYDELELFYHEVFLRNLWNKIDKKDSSKVVYFKSSIHKKINQLFNQLDVIDELLHEVRNFRPGFKNRLFLDDLVQDYLILPRETNQRIINQQGGFILSGIRIDNEYNIVKDKKFKRLKIPYEFKKNILKELKEKHSIEESYIYPELDHYNFRKYEQ